MRVLVTGASGFVGRKVMRELSAHGHEPWGMDRVSPSEKDDRFIEADLLDADALQRGVATCQPEGCIHLAGIAFVPTGWSDPRQTMDVNAGGTLQLLEACRHQSPQTRVLVVTSAEVYGREKRPEPVREEDSLTPSNVYGVSKAAADMAARLFHHQYDMPVMTARPQNHIGPGQSRLFVISAFAEQLIALRQQHHPTGKLYTGNLQSQRDFTDVRDVARAYRLLLEQGQAGHAYNIASGQLTPIGDMLETLCAHAGIQPEIVTDQALYRPTDSPPQLCIEKIRVHTGWGPEYTLAQTLRDLFDDLASRINDQPS